MHDHEKPACIHKGLNNNIIIAGPPISENPLISKTATHVTLTWSPPFFWPGQRIQHYNITVTNKNTGNSSHHILNSSFIDPIISFSMSISYLQLSTMTCTEVIFSISPVSESAPKVMQTVNVTVIINWKEDFATDLNVTEEYFVQPKGTVHSQTVTSPNYRNIFSKLF